MTSQMAFYICDKLVTDFALDFWFMSLHVFCGIFFRIAFVFANLANKWTDLKMNSSHMVDEKIFLIERPRAQIAINSLMLLFVVI